MREEVVEDDAGVISSVIVPTLVPVPEDVMEEESESTHWGQTPTYPAGKLRVF